MPDLQSRFTKSNPITAQLNQFPENWESNRQVLVPMCEGVEWHLLLSCDPTSPDLNFAMFADVTPIVDLPTLVVVQKPEFPMFAPVLQSSQCSCAPLITWNIGGQVKGMTSAAAHIRCPETIAVSLHLA